jgi:uncharacterized protein YjaZ
MPMPGLHGNFDHCEQYAESGQKSFGAFPVLLVFFHTSFDVSDTASVSVAHEAAHLRLQHIQVTQNSVFVVPSFMW